MNDYLMKFGFSPKELGYESYPEYEREISVNKTINQTSYSSKTNRNYCNEKLKDLPLAMAYVPLQVLDKRYSEADALTKGTLFPELLKPFLGKKP